MIVQEIQYRFGQIERWQGRSGGLYSKKDDSTCPASEIGILSGTLLAIANCTVSWEHLEQRH